MAEDRETSDLRNAIGRGLSACLKVEREMPARLVELLQQLARQEATRDNRHATR